MIEICNDMEPFVTVKFYNVGTNIEGQMDPQYFYKGVPAPLKKCTIRYYEEIKFHFNNGQDDLIKKHYVPFFKWYRGEVPSYTDQQVLTFGEEEGGTILITPRFYVGNSCFYTPVPEPNGDKKPLGWFRKDAGGNYIFVGGNNCAVGQDTMPSVSSKIDLYQLWEDPAEETEEELIPEEETHEETEETTENTEDVVGEETNEEPTEPGEEMKEDAEVIETEEDPETPTVNEDEKEEVVEGE